MDSSAYPHGGRKQQREGGVEARLRTHVRWALDHGATPEELEALAALLAVYAGYPKASSAIEVFRQVIAEYSAAH